MIDLSPCVTVSFLVLLCSGQGKNYKDNQALKHC